MHPSRLTRVVMLYNIRFIFYQPGNKKEKILRATLFSFVGDGKCVLCRVMFMVLKDEDPSAAGWVHRGLVGHSSSSTTSGVLY